RIAVLRLLRTDQVALFRVIGDDREFRDAFLVIVLYRATSGVVTGVLASGIGVLEDGMPTRPWLLSIDRPPERSSTIVLAVFLSSTSFMPFCSRCARMLAIAYLASVPSTFPASTKTLPFFGKASASFSAARSAADEISISSVAERCGVVSFT